MSLGNYIKQKLGMSVTALSRETGLEYNSLYRRMRGDQPFTIDDMVAIHRATDLDLLEMLKANGSITPAEVAELRAAPAPDLTHATDSALGAEVFRRLTEKREVDPWETLTAAYAAA